MEGQGLIMGITRVSIWVLEVINLLTKSALTLQVWSKTIIIVPYLLLLCSWTLKCSMGVCRAVEDHIEATYAVIQGLGLRDTYSKCTAGSSSMANVRA